MSNSTLKSKIIAARRCGTPLIIVRTADPAATSRTIERALWEDGDVPVIFWDVAVGPRPSDSERSRAEFNRATGNIKPEMLKSAASFMAFCLTLSDETVVFCYNLQRFIANDIATIQSLWNLRDKFKATSKTIIGLCPAVDLPPELKQDVLLLDEPLPTADELRAIAVDVFNSAQIPQPPEDVMLRIIDATLGLSPFPAESSMAMSLTSRGMNIDKLWDRKRTLISQAPGLSVEPAKITLEDIGGVSNAKQFMRRVMASRDAPSTFVFIDEGEKALSGSSSGGGDNTGVAQSFMGTILTRMQDEGYRGVIFVGFPGSAKSMMAKAAGATAGVPTIRFDITGMKHSHLGQSEANLRSAMDTVKAVSQGKAYFIMTCNGISTLPPELKRRFKDGIFFFDIPDAEEKEAIWSLYLRQHARSLEEANVDLTRPNDKHWTGAEISTCVENAARFGISLVDASAYIVPAYQSMGEDRAEKLRSEANGKFISASYPGPYQANRATAQAKPARTRNITVSA